MNFLSIHADATMAPHLIIFAFIVGVLSLVNVANTLDAPTVKFGLGEVRGSFFESRLGKKIYAFRGLRYAEGPIGPLRFKVMKY